MKAVLLGWNFEKNCANKCWHQEIEKFTANGTNEWGAKSYTRFTPWMQFKYSSRIQAGEQESATRVLDDSSKKMTAAAASLREAEPIPQSRYLSLDDAALKYSHVVAQSIFTLDPVGVRVRCAVVACLWIQ